MAARTLKRFIFACITIFFVIAFNFFLFRVMPGDISTIIAKATTSDAVKERLLAEAGVDQPLQAVLDLFKGFAYRRLRRFLLYL